MTIAPGVDYLPTSHTTSNGFADTNSILRALRIWSNCSERVVKNLGVFVRDGEIELLVSELDPKGYWNGEVLITFKTDFSKERMVNYIISGSYADEVHMVDENTLRLWWD